MKFNSLKFCCKWGELKQILEKRVDLTVFEDLGYSRLGSLAGNSGFGVKVGVDLESVLIWNLPRGLLFCL